MPHIARFRSIWGVEPGNGYEKWRQWFPTLKQQGYAGVEIIVFGLEDLPGLRSLCDEFGLQVTVMLFSEWPVYLGPRPAGLTANHHLDFYRKQLEMAKILEPVKINVHSGSDVWPLDESVKFYQGTLEIDKELGLQGKVCHETHRNRSLFTPYSTEYILSRVPDLKITADFSHFVVVCERLLDTAEDDKKILDKIIPHVNHIHARVGTTQASQCPDPTNATFTQEREFFENLWKQCIDEIISRDGSQASITFVPEYGPYPYHPFGSERDFSEVADAEGARLQRVFEEHIKSAST